MRRLLAAFLLVASASVARAGVLVELTDGTKLTVESHWNDGDKVHLIRGGVDMIVARSQIKSMNEEVEDPEVYLDPGGEESSAEAREATRTAAAADEPAAQNPDEGDPALSEMSPSELEAMQQQEARRLRELQEKSFNALYGGTATPQQQRQAQELVAEQNQRAAQVRTALERAKQAENGAQAQ